MSNDVLMSSSYIILFLLRLEVLYRNGHLNPLTDKRSKTLGSEVAFVEPPPSCPRGRSQPSVPLTLLSLTAHLYLSGNLSRPFYIFLYISINIGLFLTFTVACAALESI